MKTVLILVICSLFSLSTLAQSPVFEFRYNTDTGKCINSKGKEGVNLISKGDFLANKSAECGSFDFILSRGDVLKVYPGSNGVVDGFNFRGTDFSRLAFSGGPYCGINFTNADIQGAQLTDAVGVYWCIDGIIDNYSSFTLNNSGNTFGCVLSGPLHLKCVH